MGGGGGRTRRFAYKSDMAIGRGLPYAAHRASTTSTTARSPAAWPTLTHSEPTARLGGVTGAIRPANRWRASVASCAAVADALVRHGSTTGRLQGARLVSDRPSPGRTRPSAEVEDRSPPSEGSRYARSRTDHRALGRARDHRADPDDLTSTGRSRQGTTRHFAYRFRSSTGAYR
jgi:hypothetical protein